jgi:hypothetical protein
MKTRILVAIALIAASSTSFAAPQGRWSPEQQEVIDHIIACWNASMEAAEKNDVEIWLSRCPIAEGAVRWNTEEGAPRDIVSYARRNSKTTSGQTATWVDFRPLSINIYGDVAAVHFYAYWRDQTASGSEVRERKVLEVFKKIDGKWKLIAGQWTPVAR